MAYLASATSLYHFDTAPGVITTVGSVPLSTSIKKFGSTSATFNGSTSNYLTLPNNVNLNNFGTGDFTIECWVYFNNIATEQTILSCCTTWSTSQAYLLEIRSDATLRFYGGDSAAIAIISSASVVVANTWYHVAVSRVSGTTNLYLNGTSVGNSTTSATISNSSSPTIGIQKDSGAGGGVANPLNGYIDEVRITKGTAQYTANFTPSSTAFTSGSESLLLHFETDAVINSFIDSSTNGLTVTTTGAARASTFQSKFGLMSLYLDGNGSYLSIASNSQFAFGTNDFTLEGWIYLNALSNTSTIFDFRPVGTVQGTYPLVNISTNGAINYVANYGNSPNVSLSSSAGTITIGSWFHVALCKSSGTTTIYVNGTSVASASDTVNYTQSLCSFGHSNYTGYTEELNGYIDEARITKGTAQYTSNFTPSSTAFTSSGASVLLHFESFVDTGSSNLIPTATGVPVYSNTWTKFGTSSLYLNGSSGLNLTANSAFFGTQASNYTLSMWIYPTAISNTAGTHDVLFYVASSTVWRINLSITQQKLMCYFGGTTSYTLTGSTTLSTSTAYLVTVERYGNALFLYLNGNLEAAKYDTTGWSGWSGSAAANIGHSNGGTQGGGTNQPYTGYIDELAISSYARFRGIPFTSATDAFVIGTMPSGSSSILSYETSPTKSNFDAATGKMFATSHSMNLSGFFTPTGGPVQSNPIFTIPYVKPKPNYYGNGRFAGHVNIKGTVYPASVDLVDSTLGTIIATTLTNVTTGAFSFEFLNQSLTYDLIATDLTNTYENLVISNQTPLANQDFNFQLIPITKNSGIITNTDQMRIIVKGFGGYGAVIYSVDSAPGWMTVGSSTGIISGSIPPGAQSYTVRATDSLGNIATYIWSFTSYTDPYWRNVTSLLKFDGANNSTTFQDEIYTNVWTRVSTPVISTAQSKFGGSCGSFSTGKYISCPANSGFTFSSTDDFTIECWVYIPTGATFTSNEIPLIAAGMQNTSSGGGGWDLTLGDNNPLAIRLEKCYTTGSAPAATFNHSTTLTRDTWYHVAVSRQAGTVYGFINGVLLGTSSTLSGIALDNPNNRAVLIGSGSAGVGADNYYPMNGYIDDMRVTNGICRYTSNFTPPTAGYILT